MSGQISFGVDQVFDLVGPATGTDLASLVAGAVIEGLGDDIDWGNSDAVITSLQSQLVDGSLEEVASWGNRTQSLPLQIRGTDPDTMAALEAALRTEIAREGWNQITWQAPRASVPTVFDVIDADLQFVADDLDEASEVPSWTYTLVMTCLPFPRSAEPVTVTSVPTPASGAAPVVTQVDSCASVSGWSTTARTATRTNLCTNPTPISPSSSAGAWGAGTNTTTVRVASGANAGVTGAGAGGVFVVDPKLTASSPSSFTSYALGSYMPVTAGLKYSAQMRTGYFGNASVESGFLVRFYDAGKNILVEYRQTWTAGRAMTRGSGTWTAPAKAVTMATHPFATFSASSGAGSWAFDRVLVEQAATPGTYFDGTFPDAGTTQYQWAATAGASVSLATTPSTVALSSGHVATSSFGNGVPLHRAGAITVASAGLLRFSGTIGGTATRPLNAVALILNAGSQSLQPVLFDMSPTGAFTAYFRLAADVSSDGLWLFAVGSVAAWAGTMTLSLSDISTATGLPQIGSGRQARTRLPVFGSVRTQASLRVAAPSSSLGDAVLVFSCPANGRGFQYALRSAYRSSGPSGSTSSSSASGYVSALATDQVNADEFTIPCSALADSPQVLYIRLASSTTAATVTFNWSVKLASGDAPETTGTRTVKLAAGAQFVPLGVVDPPRVDDGSTDSLLLRIWANTAVPMEDAYLFDTAGNLSIISTAGASMLRLDSATLQEPRATVWVGSTDAAGNDTRVTYAAWRALVWEQHRFTPGAMDVFTVTPGYANAEVSLTYYPRWGHHAARITYGEVTDPTEALDAVVS